MISVWTSEDRESESVGSGEEECNGFATKDLVFFELLEVLKRDYKGLDREELT